MLDTYRSDNVWTLFRSKMANEYVLGKGVGYYRHLVYIRSRGKNTERTNLELKTENKKKFEFSPRHLNYSNFFKANIILSCHKIYPLNAHYHVLQILLPL